MPGGDMSGGSEIQTVGSTYGEVQRRTSMAGCVTLWIGDSLGPVERACLRSVLRQRHPLALYCYKKPTGVPDGVELRDAAEILAEKEIFTHINGSAALFADWFRYELQRRSMGTWIDTDMYVLGPLDGERPYLFGEESPGCINNAVLRLPPDSPLLPALLEIFEKKITPAWLPWHRYLLALGWKLLSKQAHMSRLPWGSTGPKALTALARRFHLDSEALPSDVFNPVPWRHAGWIMDPAISLDQVVTKRTVGVHLWNECIKRFKNKPAPEGSFLERLHREGGE